MAVQSKISAARLQQRIGNEYQIVIDSVDAEGAVGRCYADAPEIDGVVHLNDVHHLRPVSVFGHKLFMPISTIVGLF